MLSCISLVRVAMLGWRRMPNISNHLDPSVHMRGHQAVNLREDQLLLVEG